MTTPTRPYFHDPDEHFVSLVDYLHHLVEVHGLLETPELWRSGRDEFDRLHGESHA